MTKKTSINRLSKGEKMNLGMALGSIAAFTALTYFTIAQSNEINHKKEIANNIKILQATIQKQNYEGSKTNGILTSLIQTGNIRVSNLALGLSVKDKNILDKYQKAMETVILTKDNPNCYDLNKTRIISYNNCVYIQNKKINYASINRGVIDVSDADPKMKKELEASFKGLNQNEVISNNNEANKSILATYRSIAAQKYNENRVINQNNKIVQEVANNDNIPQSIKVAIIKDKMNAANSVDKQIFNSAIINNKNIFVKIDNNTPTSKSVEESKAILNAYLDITNNANSNKDNIQKIKKVEIQKQVSTFEEIRKKSGFDK